MKKPTLLICTAWILHAAAWFLPVLKGQDFRPPTVGWKAFRLAACAIWPCKGVQFETVHHEVLATVSVVTTLLFCFVLPVGCDARVAITSTVVSMGIGSRFRL
jgi:hypothetical protein